MIASIIACDHAERRGNCMLRTTGSFAALLAPYTEQVAARLDLADRTSPAAPPPQGQAPARSDAAAGRMSEDIEGADAPAGTRA